MLLADVHRARRAALLVAVRGVDHDRQRELLRQLELGAKVAVLELGLLVVADLADRHHPFLQREARQDVHDRLGQFLVVRLLRVEPDRAVVADAELPGAKALEADDRGQVVDVGAHVRARLPDPERGLYDRDDAGGGHRLVVVGHPRYHVGVRVDEHHQLSSRESQVRVPSAMRAAMSGA